jgi:cell pole-organizing protein PopZ
MSSANPKVQEPSMEEILASIRRIIADDQESARAAAPRPSIVPAPPPPEPEDVLDLANLEPPLSAAKLDLEDEEVSFRDADGQVDFDAIPIDEEPEEEAPPAFEPPPVPPLPKIEAPPPESLLSTTAQATAAGAFHMLSTTVLNSNPRTLEDLVQDMLRPMLKGWLDENLPPLVERLVRAEIERVARHGR